MVGTLYKDSWLWEVQLGRFLIPVYQMVLGYSVAPAVSTILSLGILSLTVLVLTRLLDFQGRILRYLAGMLVLASPLVQSLLSYYYCSVAYSCSFLLAVLAAVLFTRADKTQGKAQWKDIALGALLLCLSAGGYQSYLAVVVTLCLIALIFRVIHGDSARALRKQFVRCLAGGAAGVACYLIVNKCVTHVVGTQNTSARGFSTMGKIDWAGLPSRLYLYGHFYKEYFWGTELVNNDYGIVPRRYLNLIFILVAAAIVLHYLILGNGRFLRRLVAFLMMVLIPAATLSLFLFAPQISILETTGSLMTPAFSLSYLFVLALFEKTVNRPAVPVRWIVQVLAALILLMLCHMALDGQSFVRYDAHQKVTLVRNLASELPACMKDAHTDKVVLVGYPEKGYYDDRYAHLRDSVHWIVQSYGVIWPDFEGRQVSYERLCEDYAGFHYQVVGADKVKDLLSDPVIDRMPCYPEEGSIQQVGGVLVVKLSEENP